jgi:hypothetical protein
MRHPTLAQQFGCIHAEAFCLMYYRDSEGYLERIWNSRDGVTPFGVRSVQGFDSQHVDWQKDKFSPGHNPQIGDRIFVSMTVDRAKATAAEWYDRLAASEGYGKDFVEQFPDRDRAIVEHALERLNDECPDLIVVTEETLEKLEFMRPPFLGLYQRATKD